MPRLVQPEGEATPPAWRGYVSKAPVALGAPFEVIVPSFAAHLVFQITRWQSRALTLPVMGDECLVVKDEQGEPWVAAWWPADGVDTALEGGAGYTPPNLGNAFYTNGHTQAPLSQVPGAKKGFWEPLAIPVPCTATGLVYEVGNVTNGNVIVALYNLAGTTRLGVSAAVAQAGELFFQRVPFAAPLALEPGVYWAYAALSSATGTWVASYQSRPWKNETLGAHEAPATFTPPTELVNTGVSAPLLGTY